MPWEYRYGRARYYTRSRRIDGVLTREYLGSGPLAEAAAQADAEARHALTTQRQARASGHALDRALDRQLDDLCHITDDLVRLALTAAGYHQHARGQWRKTRASTTTTTQTTETTTTATPPDTIAQERAQRHIYHHRCPASPPLERAHQPVDRPRPAR